MTPSNSWELLRALKQCGYLREERDPFWWPKSGTFSVVPGTLLTQQTKWGNVEIALANLEQAGLNRLESIAKAPVETIAPLIKPSGFYHTKAERLRLLCANILETFGSFENFQEKVTREWLLAQKGIGDESADSILCYGCRRATFVVDSYTARLLEALGYRFESYGAIQEWMMAGIEAHSGQSEQLYGREMPLHQLYARFHGKIVEYAKEHIRGRTVDLAPLLNT
jgi:endonuclease-3 related protein